MNRSTTTIVLTVSTALMLACMTGVAAVPGMVNYQGRLVLGGALVNSNDMAVVLSIHTASGGGTLLYQENDTVDVVDGLFSTTLGDNSNGSGTQPTLTDALSAAGANAWLGIAVAGDPELTPRERILAAPYALVTDGGVGTEQDPIWTNAQANGFTVGGPVVLPADGLRVGGSQLTAASGCVGIGTATPWQPLDVHGDVAVGGSTGSWDAVSEMIVLRGQSEFWYVAVENKATAADSDFFIGLGNSPDGKFHIENGGSVGIGTTSPADDLHLHGVAPQLRITASAEEQTGLLIADYGSEDDEFAKIVYDCFAEDLLFYVNDTNSPVMKIDEYGLFVNEDAFIGNGAQADAEAESLRIRAQGDEWYVGVLNAAAAADSDLFFGTGVSDSLRHLTVEPDGDVGIGPVNPLDHLHVEGYTSNIRISNEDETEFGLLLVDEDVPTAEFAKLFFNSSSVNDFRIYINNMDAPRFMIEEDGDVGIGTASPGGHRLKVVNSNDTVNGAATWIQNDHPDGIALMTEVASSDVNTILKQVGSGDFLYCDGWYPTHERVIELKKDGTIVCKVLTITGGSDIAEPFDVQTDDGTLEPGMVVSIDPDNSGDLRIADTPYDRCVAGIVSGAGGVNPGMLMKQTATAADGEHPVALTGRVYCWVDASYGPIQPGDMLTTSATPGHAMKVADRSIAHGAVLGKAMSPLPEGRGLVLTLVTLH